MAYFRMNGAGESVEVRAFNPDGGHTDDELAFYNNMLSRSTSNQREALYSQYIKRLEQRLQALEAKAEDKK